MDDFFLLDFFFFFSNILFKSPVSDMECSRDWGSDLSRKKNTRYHTRNFCTLKNVFNHTQ